MSLTLQEASDEIQGLFWDAWRALAPAANGGDLPAVQWPGVEDEPTPADKPFARFTMRHNTTRGQTLAPPGSRRFTRPGVLTVQVFAPTAAGGGLSLAQSLAIIARNAYEGVGTSSGIWFRNSRVQYIGVSGAWHQMNVTHEFEYDEVR
jgi:hypothetical protein